MSEINPVLSIYMTTYNGEKYLDRAIQSVLNQSFTNWELIIINNFSSDNTRLILNNYLNNKKIKIVHTDNLLPRTSALNFALKHTNKESKFLMNLDSDDILDYEWAKKGIDYIYNRKEVGCISGAAYIINEENEIMEIFKVSNFAAKINDHFYYTFPIVHSSTIFRKDLLEKSEHIYNENIEIGQDWDLFINISRITEIHYLNIFSVYWRRYDESVTGDKKNQITSRLDKIKNLDRGKLYISNFKHKIKNRSRRGVENLVLSFLYLKNGEIYKFVYRLLISFILNPIAILNNNKVLSLFRKRKEFYQSK